MVLCDVGVLVSAGMTESPHHARCRAAVRGMIASGQRYGSSELVLAAVIRISTNPRVWKTPATLASSFAFVNALRTHPNAVALSPAGRHWQIFEDLTSQLQIRGADTTDAYLAALAQEHGCEWWTIDRGFARFPSLRWRNLLEPSLT